MNTASKTKQCCTCQTQTLRVEQIQSTFADYIRVVFSRMQRTFIRSKKALSFYSKWHFAILPEFLNSHYTRCIWNENEYLWRLSKLLLHWNLSEIEAHRCAWEEGKYGGICIEKWIFYARFQGLNLANAIWVNQLHPVEWHTTIFLLQLKIESHQIICAYWNTHRCR